MQGLRKMKKNIIHWFASEVRGALKMMKHLVLQMYWTAILAVAIQYSEGTLGDIKVFVAYTVLLRLVKIPL